MAVAASLTFRNTGQSVATKALVHPEYGCLNLGPGQVAKGSVSVSFVPEMDDMPRDVGAGIEFTYTTRFLIFGEESLALIDRNNCQLRILGKVTYGTRWWDREPETFCVYLVRDGDETNPRWIRCDYDEQKAGMSVS